MRKVVLLRATWTGALALMYVLSSGCGATAQEGSPIDPDNGNPQTVNPSGGTSSGGTQTQSPPGGNQTQNTTTTSGSGFLDISNKLCANQQAAFCKGNTASTFDSCKSVASILVDTFKKMSADCQAKQLQVLACAVAQPQVCYDSPSSIEDVLGYCMTEALKLATCTKTAMDNKEPFGNLDSDTVSQLLSLELTLCTQRANGKDCLKPIISLDECKIAAQAITWKGTGYPSCASDQIVHKQCEAKRTYQCTTQIPWPKDRAACAVEQSAYLKACPVLQPSGG